VNVHSVPSLVGRAHMGRDRGGRGELRRPPLEVPQVNREPTQQPDMLATLNPAVAKNFDMPGDRLNAEMWLAGRMREHDVHTVFDGVTDSDMRKARFREAIVRGGLEFVMACHAEDGRTAETYSEAFERIYGEPLELDVSKRARRKKAAPGAGPREDSVAAAADSSRPPELPELDDDAIAF
jgi:hypothetical protein